MYFGAAALPSATPRTSPPTPRMPLAPMIVVGDVLRIPAAISLFDTASTETRGLMRSTSRDAFADEGLERALAEAWQLLPGDGAEAAVVGSAVHEVPPVSHRRGRELREEEHGAPGCCDSKNQNQWHVINLGKRRFFSG